MIVKIGNRLNGFHSEQNPIHLAQAAVLMKKPTGIHTAPITLHLDKFVGKLSAQYTTVTSE
jgi:hypothetical protein